MQQAYVLGVSTRRVDQLVERLGFLDEGRKGQNGGRVIAKAETEALWSDFLGAWSSAA